MCCYREEIGKVVKVIHNSSYSCYFPASYLLHHLHKRYSDCTDSSLKLTASNRVAHGRFEHEKRAVKRSTWRYATGMEMKSCPVAINYEGITPTSPREIELAE